CSLPGQYRYRRQSRRRLSLSKSLLRPFLTSVLLPEPTLYKDFLADFEALNSRRDSTIGHHLKNDLCDLLLRSTPVECCTNMETEFLQALQDRECRHGA